MKTQLLTLAAILSAATFFCRTASAQSSDRTPPVSTEETEAIYNATIESRTLKIMQVLSVTDATKSNRVYYIIISNYHALRHRDQAVDEELSDLPAGSSEWRVQRNTMIIATSQPFHDRFIAMLSKELTPAQIEMVKDQLTYDKVKFTYSAYCSIIPNLTDEQKAKILELLKEAREVAIEGGSAGEKTDIFQRYKDQINSYLGTQGIDVNKAIQDWNVKHPPSQTSSNSITRTN
jgi:Protein of unknown function (DUF3826)